MESPALALAAAAWQGWRGRAAGERVVRAIAIDQRHSGHSLVPRPWLYYQKAHARAFTGARSLHPPTITTRMGSGVNHVPRVMAVRKRTNERSCIIYCLVSKESKPSGTNDPHCKEDDTVALLWPFRKNVFSGRTRMRGYVG